MTPMSITARGRCRAIASVLALAAAMPHMGHASGTHSSPAMLGVTLRPETDAGKQVVAITVNERIAEGGAAGPLSLTAPLDFIGMIPFATRMSDVVARDANGALALTVRDTTLADGTTVRNWRSDRAVSGAATLRYRLALSPPTTGGPPYGAKAGASGVSGNSATVVVIPDGVRDGRHMLGWDLSAMTAGSRGVMTGGEGTITIEGSPDGLLDRWFMAGRLHDGQPRSRHGFNAYTLGTPPFPAAATMAWARSVYRALAKGFGYLGTPRYELLIRTLDRPSYATGTAARAGGGSLITTGSPTYVRDQTDLDVRNTIAHEMGHQWVGQFDGGGALWFAEGLNVYVTSTLPCEAGLQPWADCGTQIGKWARAYYGSEGRDWSQARIEASPFGREDLRLVSYGRGMMYFANLDATIRSRSGGRRTLLIALRPLFERRQAGSPITLRSWEAWLGAEAGAAEVARFRATVLDGALIEPSPSAFGPYLALGRASYRDGATTRPGYVWRVRRRDDDPARSDADGVGVGTPIPAGRRVR